MALALVLACVNAGVLFGGRTLLVPGLDYQGPRPETTTTNDPAAASNISFPQDAFTAVNLRSGVFPFWNPHQGLGHPFLGNGLSALLYPLNWLVMALPFSWFDAVYLLNWLLAAVFLFLYLDELGLARPFAIAGAAALFVGGQAQLNLPLREVSESATTLPLLLYGVERAIRQPNWAWRHAALAAGVFGAVAGGQAEVYCVSLFAVLIYALVRIARARRAWLGALRAIAPGAILGLVVSTPAWLPFALNWASSASSHGTHRFGTDHLGAASLATYFFPYFFGRVQQYPFGEIGGWNWSRSYGWSQAGCLFLAVCSLIAGRKRAGLAALWCLFAIPLAKILGVPVINQIGELPVFREIKFPCYAAFLPEFAVCGLAACGLQLLADADAKVWRRCLIVWAAVVLTIFALGLRALHGPDLAQPTFRIFGLQGLLWTALAPLGIWWVHRKSADPMRRVLVAGAAILLQGIATAADGYTLQTYRVLGVVALALYCAMVLGAAHLPAHATRPLFGTLLAAVAAIQIPVAARGGPGLARRHNPLPRQEFIDVLARKQQDNRFRSYSLQSALQADLAAPREVSSLNVLEALLPRTSVAFSSQLLDRSSNATFFAGYLFHERAVSPVDEYETNRAFFDMLAVRYLVTTSPLQQRHGSPPLTLAFEQPGEAQLWESSSAFERAFGVGNVILVGSPDEALAELGAMRALPPEDARQRLRSTAWVVRSPDGKIEAALEALARQPASPLGELTGFRLRANDVRISFQAKTAGVLVLADSISSGWAASVDGEATPVLMADGALRGVYLPGAGIHEVHFRYRPPLWNWILVATAVGLILLALATWADLGRGDLKLPGGLR